MAPDPRRTRAWRRLRDQVIADQPTCQLQIPGVCTGRSTTADHIIETDIRPDLAMVRANLRGACQPCNSSRGATYGNRKRTGAAGDQPAALGFFS